MRTVLLAACLGACVSWADSANAVIVTARAGLFPIGQEVGFWEGEHRIFVDRLRQSDIGRVWVLAGQNERCGELSARDLCDIDGVITSTQGFGKLCWTLDAGACGGSRNRARTAAGLLGVAGDDSVTSCLSFPCSPPPPPPPCGLVIDDTTTWVVTSSGQAVPAQAQLQFGLTRHEGRPESAVYLEEWAVVSVAGRKTSVSSMSSAEFGARVAGSMPSNVPAGLAEGTLLLIEAADPSHDPRHVVAATVEPLDVQTGSRHQAQREEIWFRAEVDESGNVDRLVLIDVDPQIPRSSVETALRARLRLRSEHDTMHRSVVFAHATLTSGGRLTVASGLVLRPQCCCGDCCYDPEFGWRCPCGGPCLP